MKVKKVMVRRRVSADVIHMRADGLSRHDGKPGVKPDAPRPSNPRRDGAVIDAVEEAGQNPTDSAT
jgi:hypothetical protein